MSNDDKEGLISPDASEEQHEQEDEGTNREHPVAALNREDKQGDHDQSSSSSDDYDDEEGRDYAYRTRRRYGTRTVHRGTTWWFQEPAIKRNLWVVLIAWGFVFVGIACFITGIGLEIAYHNGFDDIIRGFVFVIVAAIILLPSLYVVIHVYLAAKRVGRIRFSSVWFFTK